MAMNGGIPPAFHSSAIPVFGFCGSIGRRRAKVMDSLVKALADRGLYAVINGQGTLEEGNYGIGTGITGPDPVSDLILVDCPREAHIPKLLLDDHPGPEESGILQSFSREGQLDAVLSCLVDRITEIWRETPVWACVLIGGKSSRMGRPKHLIEDDTGIPWITKTVGLLRPLVDGLVISGAGDVPSDLDDLNRLPDISGAVGPLAGILSAMQWRPSVSWLLVACDMPDIMEEAVNWLLEKRRPGIWGILPRLRDGGPCEPLLAHYDFRCRHLFEELVCSGSMRISTVAENPKIETPVVPEPLLPSWRNVNTPQDLYITK